MITALKIQGLTHASVGGSPAAEPPPSAADQDPLGRDAEIKVEACWMYDKGPGSYYGLWHWSRPAPLDSCIDDIKARDIEFVKDPIYFTVYVNESKLRDFYINDS